MVPLVLLRDTRFVVANVVTFTVYFSLSAILFFLPMTVVSAWHLPEISAAAAAVAPLSVFIGRLVLRVGAGRLIAFGATLIATEILGMGLTDPWADFWRATFPSAVFLGAGMAFIVTPLSTVVMPGATQSSTGAASAVNNAVSRIAGLLAVASMGSVAAWAYACTGGPIGFGPLEDRLAHVVATNARFQTICLIATRLAIASATLSFVFLRNPPHPTRAHSASD